MTNAAADRHVPGPDDEQRARKKLLAEVAHGGMPTLALIVIHAQQGDPTAAGMPLGALLRAVPEIGWLASYELLHQVGLHDDQLLGELTPVQRHALGQALNHAPHPHQAA
jgi:hypothetical protein